MSFCCFSLLVWVSDVGLENYLCFWHPIVMNMLFWHWHSFTNESPAGANSILISVCFSAFCFISLLKTYFFSHIISAIFLGSICYSFHLTFSCCLCIMRKMCHILSISNYVGCSVNEEKPIVNYHNILFSHTKKLNACDLPEHLETTDGKSETGVEPEK